jgi:hypothetical protein
MGKSQTGRVTLLPLTARTGSPRSMRAALLSVCLSSTQRGDWRATSGPRSTIISELAIDPGWLVHTNQPAPLQRDVSWSRREVDRGRETFGPISDPINPSRLPSRLCTWRAPSAANQLPCHQQAPHRTVLHCTVQFCNPVQSSQRGHPGRRARAMSTALSSPKPPSCHSRKSTFPEAGESIGAIAVE